jgi:hypothetical protein
MPLISDVIAGHVQLGETVRADIVDAPLSAIARMLDRSNASIASGRKPSRTTMITRRIAVGVDILDSPAKEKDKNGARACVCERQSCRL